MQDALRILPSKCRDEAVVLTVFSHFREDPFAALLYLLDFVSKTIDELLVQVADFRGMAQLRNDSASSSDIAGDEAQRNLQWVKTKLRAFACHYARRVVKRAPWPNVIESIDAELDEVIQSLSSLTDQVECLPDCAGDALRKASHLLSHQLFECLLHAADQGGIDECHSDAEAGTARELVCHTGADESPVREPPQRGPESPQRPGRPSSLKKITIPSEKVKPVPAPQQRKVKHEKKVTISTGDMTAPGEPEPPVQQHSSHVNIAQCRFCGMRMLAIGDAVEQHMKVCTAGRQA
jgi:hypothetical protein